MTDIPMPSIASRVLSAPMSVRTRKHTGYFRHLIAALHYSRRLQAASVLRRYRHLLDTGGEQAAKSIFEHKEFDR